jgi:hypothetical protein
MDIQPVGSSSSHIAGIGGDFYTPQPKRETVSDVPENVFAPPGVLTRLTAMLQTVVPSQAPRPEVVAKAQDLASKPDYPGQQELSAVVDELIGGKKA